MTSSITEIMEKIDKISIKEPKSMIETIPWYDKEENLSIIIKCQYIIRNYLSNKKKTKKDKKTKKEILVDKVFKPNLQGFSEWIEREIWEKTDLNWGRNGNGRGGIYFSDKRYIWDVRRGKHSKITHLRTMGLKNDSLYGASRPIRRDIEAYHKAFGCVACGTKTDLVTDHKNDLYNDLRVLNTKTQTIDDFQCLCRRCNLLKRQTTKETKKSGKRYRATMIPCLRPYGIDFIEGNETFDEMDINAMVGTYWYDVIAFHEYLAKSRSI